MRKQHREDLISYICNLYGIDVPSGFILKQIKDFQDDFGYTLKGMELALRYFHEIEGNGVDAKGIGIIPFIYEDARRYHMNINRIKQAAIQSKNVPTNTEVVRISAKHRKQKKLINIEGL